MSNPLKPLFDAAELLKEAPVEKVLILKTGDPEQEPKVTIKIDDNIRSMERNLFKKHNEFVVRFNGNDKEGHIRDNRLEYAYAMIDLCVIDSSGIFNEGHSAKLMKRACLRYPDFLRIFLDAISEAFSGDLKIKDEESKKN